MSEVTLSLSMQEEIPTVQYGNVTIGPVTITRTGEDTPEGRARLRAEVGAELKAWYTEQRAILTDLVRSAYKSTGQETKH